MASETIYCNALYEGERIVSKSGLRGFIRNAPDSVVFAELAEDGRLLMVSDLTPEMNVIVAGVFKPGTWMATVTFRNGRTEVA